MHVTVLRKLGATSGVANFRHWRCMHVGIRFMPLCFVHGFLCGCTLRHAHHSGKRRLDRTLHDGLYLAWLVIHRISSGLHRWARLVRIVHSNRRRLSLRCVHDGW